MSTCKMVYYAYILHILSNIVGTMLVTGTATPKLERPFADKVIDQVAPVETMA